MSEIHAKMSAPRCGKQHPTRPDAFGCQLEVHALGAHRQGTDMMPSWFPSHSLADDLLGVADEIHAVVKRLPELIIMQDREQVRAAVRELALKLRQLAEFAR